jgi:Mg/Co/Ni transporter MgtE
LKEVHVSDRLLTDADVAAIVDKLKEEIARDLFAEAGKGLWQTVRKGLIWLLVAFALVNISGGKSLSNIIHAVR